MAKGKRQKAKGKRQKAKGKRQKAKGKRQKAKGKKQKAKSKRISNVAQMLLIIAIIDNGVVYTINRSNNPRL